MKKVISLVVTIALVVTGVMIYSPFNSSPPVQAEQYRMGFKLTPNEFDSTGVKTGSTFTLESLENVTLDFVKQNMWIVEMEKPTITAAQDDNTFIITPAEELKQNKLYTFKLTKDGQDISWTFQSTLDFAVLGTLPGNRSSNVPINTGIEIYLTHNDFDEKEISKFFEISPSVDGKFEVHGNTVVFMPKKLDTATLYTVTIKEGLPLKGSKQMLAEDYMFSFETSVEEYNDDSYKGFFYYSKMINEFSPTEKPMIPFNFQINNKIISTENTINILTNVYMFKDIDSFIDGINRKESVPSWAQYSYWIDNKIDTNGMEKVLDFTQEVPVNSYDNRFIQFPDSLSEGYYLIESTWEDIHFQTFVQATDIAMYIADSNENTAVWLNDISTGNPVTNALIENINTGATFKTDVDGVAMFKTISKDESEESIDQNSYFKVTTDDGKNAVLSCFKYNVYNNYYDNFSSNTYWRYFQTDRSLYKPDDTVEFWGFIKNRYTNEDVDELTVEIGQGSWYFPGMRFMAYFMPFISEPFVTQKVKLDEGFYEGSLKLPSLEPGGYQITIKYGDEVVNSYYISVENYIKPAYKIDISKDKEAIFAGETINFTVKTSFFEGTPVANLDLRTNIYGLSDSLNKVYKTDIRGEVKIPYTPAAPNDERQGQSRVYFNSSADLPESGQINGNTNVRVFINNVNVSFKNETKDGQTTITAQLNEIVLDRINAGTEEDYNDYLGNPVSDRILNGKIIKHTRVKHEDGQYYDYINKVVKTRYRYETKKETVTNFDMTSDSEGKAEYQINLSDDADSYYTAEINCIDNNGRNMKFDVYMNMRNYESFYNNNNDYYHLEADKENYKLNEEVKAEFKLGDENLPDGSYIFIESQNGIRRHVTSDDAIYSGVFDAENIPNYYLTGVYFNGRTYVSSQLNIRYDYEEKTLNITAVADKDSYKPGDECTLNIKAVDLEGRPINARVNIAIVDEALLKLSDQHIDVLESLYSRVASGVNYTYASHLNSNDEMMQSRNDVAKSEDSAEMAYDMADPLPLAGRDESDSGSTYIREEFKDTAYFKTVALDKNGYGSISFKLPDNITSWRVVMAGLSTGLNGGTGREEIKVSQPFFINQSMSSTYLAGDNPYIGVTAYGDSLKEGDVVTYKLTSPQKSGMEVVIEGRAFERVNIPLWELEEGTYEIVIEAITGLEHTDGVKQTITVASTYHEIEVAEYSKLNAGMMLSAGTQGMTTLVFTDEGRGKLLPTLYNLAYSGGNRIDQKYISMLARDIITTNYEEAKLWGEVSETELSDYQNADGGFGILPYAASDLRTTALMTPLVLNNINTDKLKQYYYSKLYDGKDNVKAAMLYGMAVLGEPILLELNKAASVRNLTTEDYIFIALAYAQLGEKPVANQIFIDKLIPVLEDKDPYIRVKTGNDEDLSIQYTALAAILASELDREEKDGMFSYFADKRPEKVLVNAEKLNFITNELDKLSDKTVEISYTYDGNTYNETLENGHTLRVTIPSQKIQDFKINSVKGDASVISIYKKPLAEGSFTQDKNLSVTRKYYTYNGSTTVNEFNQNDIVKVVIDWDIKKGAIDSGYEITDYVPSGLKPINSPCQAGIRSERGYRWYRNMDGQKVTFYVNKNMEEKTSLLYYARVTNPGLFKAEAPIIQGTIDRESMRLGEQTMITISK